MSKSLSEKIAIVTGGSRGIGAAIAVELAKRGASGIAITYLSNASAATSTVQAIESHRTQAIAITADVSNPESAHSVVRQTQQAFSSEHIDILVNNAADTSLYALEAITAENFHSTFDTNVLGPMLLIQAVMPHIRRGGRIINISSRQARLPMMGGLYLYGASKAALEHFTRNVALEWAAQKGITVNTVMPGPTDTDGMRGAPAEVRERAASAATAEKRLGRPEEIASVVAFVAEDGSRWINGDTINVTGGAIMF